MSLNFWLMHCIKELAYLKFCYLFIHLHTLFITVVSCVLIVYTTVIYFKTTEQLGLNCI